jgi:hypothetical protein
VNSLVTFLEANPGAFAFTPSRTGEG